MQELFSARSIARHYDFSTQTLEIIEKIAGMGNARDLCDETARELLPLKLMDDDKLASFGDRPRQTDTGKDLDEMRSNAGKAKKVFDESIASWLRGIGRDPSEKILVRVPGKEGKEKTFEMLKAVDLKTVPSCNRKTRNELGGDHSLCCDVVRCSITVDGEGLIAMLLKAFLDGQVPGVTVVRLKNRFANPIFTGIRDCLLNVEVEYEKGCKHICEIQLHFAPILALKGLCHEYYEHFRDYFRGSNESYKKRLQMFGELGELGNIGRGGEGGVEDGLKRILEGTSEEKLAALSDISEGHVLGDPSLFKMTSEVLAEVIKEKHGEIKEFWAARGKVATACRQMGGYGLLQQSLAIFWEVLRGQEELFEKESAETLKTCCQMALSHKECAQFGEAVELFERALKGLKKIYGPDHKETLSCLAQMGLLYDTMAKYGMPGALDKAVGYTEQALEGRERILGPDNPSTLESVGNLGTLYGAMGEVEKSLAMALRVLHGFERSMGADHLNTLAAIGNVSGVYMKLGNTEKAMEYKRREYSNRCRARAKDHEPSVACLKDLVSMSVQLDVDWSDEPQKFGEQMKKMTLELVVYNINGYGQELVWALKLCEWLLKGQVKCLSEDHEDVKTTLNNTGMVYWKMGNQKRSAEYLSRAGTAVAGGITSRGGMESQNYSSSSSLASLGNLDSEEEEILRNAGGGTN